MKCKALILGAALLIAASAAPLFAQEETVDFEGIPPGTIVSQVFGSGGSGPILVHGIRSPRPEDENFAVIFDSSCGGSNDPADCSGGDKDLGTPNEDFGGPGVGEGGRPGVRSRTTPPSAIC